MLVGLVGRTVHRDAPLGAFVERVGGIGVLVGAVGHIAHEDARIGAFVERVDRMEGVGGGQCPLATRPAPLLWTLAASRYVAPDLRL
jgi:hypothetical protein